MLQIILFLYPMTVTIGILGYFPQLFQLVKASSLPDGFAFHTWIVWLFTSFITMLYGLLHLQDIVFSTVVAINFLMNAIIILVAINKYLQDTKNLSNL